MGTQRTKVLFCGSSLYSSCFLPVRLIYDKILYSFQSDTKNLYKRLTHLKSDVHARQKFRRSGFLGLFGPKVNIVDHYGKKLEDLEENVRLSQSEISLEREVGLSLLFL